MAPFRPSLGVIALLSRFSEDDASAKLDRLQRPVYFLLPSCRP
jgi:hypothetical protein